LELANLVNTANQNETDRQAFFDDLVEDIDELQSNYQELLDTGVLQTNINTKLEALEEEYAPKLTEVTTQMAQITLDASEFGVKYDGTDEREALQNAINYCVENFYKLQISKPVRAEPIEHIDETMLSLYVYIEGDTSHTYREGFELEFKKGAYLYSESKVESTLLRVKASNSKFINLSLKGVRGLTTLLEL